MKWNQFRRGKLCWFIAILFAGASLAFAQAPSSSSKSSPADASKSSKTASLNEQAGKGTVVGRVRDSGGKAVPGALVSLQATTNADTEIWKARTDASGTFKFEGVRAGNYTVGTGESGSSLTIHKSVELAAGEVKKVELVLEKTPSPPQDSLAVNAPALFDEPQFTVAGVTSATNAGGHGSDTVLRNSETLVRDTASLAGGENPPKAATKNPAEEGQLLQEGSEIQAEILRQEGPSGEASELRTRDAKLDLETRQKRADLYRRLAQIDERLGNPLEAVHEYERAAELAPSETNLFDWGTELLTHRALEPAAAVFEKGTVSYPKSVRMLIGLGVAWYARGADDRAVEYLARASDLAPADPVPYLFMGKVQSAGATASPSVAERLARFAKMAPENALAQYYYAVALWKLMSGSADDAGAAKIENLLQSAIRIDPKLAAAHLQLGELYGERGDNTRAIAEYVKATEIDPESGEAHYRLGMTYRKAGDAADAAKEFELHAKLVKQGEEREERERGEVQEFVITLRDK